MRAVEKIMGLDILQARSLAASKVDAKTSQSAPDVTASAVKQAADAVSWGRTTCPKWFATIGATALIIFCPIWIWLNWAALEHFDGSLMAAIHSVYSPGPPCLTWQYIHSHSHATAAGYMAWVVFQALLYHFLPGKTSRGQQTPGGNVLSYTINGYLAFCMSLLLFLGTSVAGVIRPSIIAEQ